MRQQYRQGTMEDSVTEIAELRSRVAEACRVLGVFDLTLGTLGHASARLPQSDRIVIRARGPAETGVRYTSDNDVIEIDLNGRRVDNDTDDGYSPPIEVHIHTEIYRRRPEVNSVVHVHPSMVVLLTICDIPLLPIYGAYDPHSLRIALAAVPIFAQSRLIQSPALGQELATTMGASQVCLMRGHGITTAANSVEEATLLAIHLNELATMTYHAALLGGARTIPVEEQDAFRALDANVGYGQPILGAPSGRAANLWLYYTRLAKDRGR
jgi:ribulose-5-phosphate 4-epimerase/fuculose-1-phosphate aldolase